MQLTALLLLLFGGLWAAELDGHLAAIKDARLFLRHNDLFVPLTPVLWGQMAGKQRMLIALQHRGDPSGLVDALGRLGHAHSLYAVDRRGLLPFDAELFSGFEEEVLKASEDSALVEQYDRISRAMGATEGFSNPFDQIVLVPNVKDSDVARLPLKYWKSLSREQFGEVASSMGLAMALNQMHAAGLSQLAESILFRKSDDQLECLVATKSRQHYNATPGQVIRLLDAPGVLQLGDLTEGARDRFAQRLIASMDVLELLLQLDPPVMEILGKLYGRLGAKEATFDKGWLEASWGRIFKFCPPFSKIFTKQMQNRKDAICERLADPKMTGAERAEAFMLEACEVAFTAGADAAALHELAKRYVERLQSGAGGEAAALSFLGKVKKQAVDVRFISWNVSAWGRAQINELRKLPSRFPEYTELFVAAFLLGSLNELPKSSPQGSNSNDWRSFGSAKTLEERLAKRWLREHASEMGRALLWLIEKDPVSVRLPDDLLKAIIETSKMDSSIRTAILAHAARQDGRHGLLLQANSLVPIPTAPETSVFGRLSLPRLNLFLAAAPTDAITLLLPARAQRLVLAKNSLPPMVIQEICEHVLTARYDPDDLQLLVALLEEHLDVIDGETLRKVQLRLLQIEATEIGRVPDPEAMNRLAMLLNMKNYGTGELAELTLEEAGKLLTSLFPTARVPILGESGKLELLSIDAAVDSLLWKTPGHEISSAALLQLLSWAAPDRTWADDLMDIAGQIVDALDTSNALSLLQRIYSGSQQLVESLYRRLAELGMDPVSATANNLLAPAVAFLARQEDQAGLESLLVASERSSLSKSKLVDGLQIFMLNTAPILDRYFQLGSTEIRAAKAQYDAAHDLTGDIEAAFRLISLAKNFHNLPMVVLWELLKANNGSIARAAAAIKSSIVNA